MENIPTKLEFSQNLNTTFHLDRGGDRAIPLKLIEFRVVPADPGYEQFSLLFHGPQDFVLPREVFQLRHGCIGAFDLSLVALGSDRNGLYYKGFCSRSI
ncbi:MAG TPA: hypothetical protein VI524_06720 [Anaerolineales bacterium]|nr:hypothetical protein [Anaerolineales bacterium]